MSADDGLDRFEVFIQWDSGESHVHAETVSAPDPEMALHLAKRNVDVRREPLDIWVVPRDSIVRTSDDDTTLTPSIDRSYRNVQWYAENDPKPDV